MSYKVQYNCSQKKAAGKPSDNEYVKKLDEVVYKARRNKEWRREYMTLLMRDLENQEIGIEKETD